MSVLFGGGRCVSVGHAGTIDSGEVGRAELAAPQVLCWQCVASFYSCSSVG